MSADPSRRRFVAAFASLTALSAGGAAAQTPRTTATAATGRFDVAWPTISRHLAVLRDAGLVLAEREGAFVRYTLHTTVFEDLLQRIAAWGPGPELGP